MTDEFFHITFIFQNAGLVNADSLSDVKRTETKTWCSTKERRVIMKPTEEEFIEVLKGLKSISEMIFLLSIVIGIHGCLMYIK